MRKLLAVSVLLSCTMPAGASRLIFESDFDHAPEGPYSRAEAARFLTQATFGPTLESIEELCRIGYEAWFAQQFSAPVSRQLPFLDSLLLAGQTDVWQDKRQEIWWRNVLTGPDQLRQRMAFALSQILVVSDDNGALEGNPTTLAHYYDLLAEHAFGNYRALLEAVTLHPAMGHYLSMFKNRKPDEAQNIRPDENFAREIMQLFSIGLWQLNPDGTLRDGDPARPGSPADPDLRPADDPRLRPRLHRLELLDLRAAARRRGSAGLQLVVVDLLSLGSEHPGLAPAPGLAHADEALGRGHAPTATSTTPAPAASSSSTTPA
ncbi:MAG: DUF1800 family protein [Xanthomonadales bacterium]|nr:DUF1800 family protein [Xanthomonadales bacterium]